MKRIPFLAFSMLCAFSLQANPANPQISNVEVSSSLGSLQVKYDLDEDAVVTMEVLVNDVAIEDDKVTTLEGAVNRKVAAGVEQTIVWKAYKDWPDQTVEANALSVRLTAWAPARPPDYMVIDLRATAPAPRIRYYASAEAIPGGVADRRYKSDYLVMRHIPDQPTGRRGKWDEVRLGGIGETDSAIGARILRLSVRGGAFLDLGRRVGACA